MASHMFGTMSHMLVIWFKSSVICSTWAVICLAPCVTCFICFCHMRHMFVTCLPTNTVFWTFFWFYKMYLFYMFLSYVIWFSYVFHMFVICRLPSSDSIYCISYEANEECHLVFNFQVSIKYYIVHIYK